MCLTEYDGSLITCSLLGVVVRFRTPALLAKFTMQNPLHRLQRARHVGSQAIRRNAGIVAVLISPTDASLSPRSPSRRLAISTAE